MPNFYKVDIEGLAAQQEVHNILYYVDQATKTATFDTAKMGELATLVEAACNTYLHGALASAYAAQQVAVSLINENQETVSPYEVIISADGTGSLAGEMATPGVCHIFGFRVTYLQPGQLARTPRRSYVAIGPITEGVFTTNGLSTLATSPRENVETFLSMVHTGVLSTYQPVRVGRVSPENGPSYGAVVDATMRPYVSFRRSRMISPTGQ